jgi:hypothetical protein
VDVWRSGTIALKVILWRTGRKMDRGFAYWLKYLDKQIEFNTQKGQKYNFDGSLNQL